MNNFINRVKTINKKLVVYHVAPKLKESELVYVQPSQILSYDLGKEDVSKYIHNRLQLLIPDKKAAEGDTEGTIATEKDRLDIELQTYMKNAEQILDFNIVSHSVEHIKKIHDRSEGNGPIPKKFTAAAMWQSRAGGPADLLQKYSETMTNAFSAIKHCPFQETVPVSLQTALTISQK